MSQIIFDDSPLTPDEIAAAARMEAKLEPLVAYVKELRHLRSTDPGAFHEVDLGTREFWFGPQHNSSVRVDLGEVVLEGRVQDFDLEANTLEIDFYGWFGEFQITHCVARITMGGKLITSEGPRRPLVWA